MAYHPDKIILSDFIQLFLGDLMDNAGEVVFAVYLLYFAYGTYPSQLFITVADDGIFHVKPCALGACPFYIGRY